MCVCRDLDACVSVCLCVFDLLICRRKHSQKKGRRREGKGSKNKRGRRPPESSTPLTDNKEKKEETTREKERKNERKRKKAQNAHAGFCLFACLLVVFDTLGLLSACGALVKERERGRKPRRCTLVCWFACCLQTEEVLAGGVCLLLVAINNQLFFYTLSACGAFGAFALTTLNVQSFSCDFLPH